MKFCGGDIIPAKNWTLEVIRNVRDRTIDLSDFTGRDGNRTGPDLRSMSPPDVSAKLMVVRNRRKKKKKIDFLPPVLANVDQQGFFWNKFLGFNVCDGAIVPFHFSSNLD